MAVSAKGSNAMDPLVLLGTIRDLSRICFFSTFLSQFDIGDLPVAYGVAAVRLGQSDSLRFRKRILEPFVPALRHP